MANAFNIEDIRDMYRADYEPGLMQALQLSANTMEDKVRVFHLTGKETEIDAIGKTELDLRTKRMQEKSFEELAFRKRYMRPAALAKSLTLSKDDFKFKGKLAVKMQDLHDQLVKAAARAYLWVTLGVTRDKDPAANANTVPSTADKTGAAGVTGPYSSTNIYIGGMFGINQVSDDDGSTRVDEALPMQPIIGGTLTTDYFTEYTKAGQIDMENTNVIPANYVLTGKPVNTDLTITKIRAAREALEARHAINADEMMYMMITPHQKSMLYADQRLQKECGWQILKDGLMSEIMGLRLVVSNYVPKVQVGGKWVRACPVWDKESMGFGMWDSVSLKAYELDQLSYDQIAIDFQVAIGAARLRTESFLTIHCDEEAEVV